MSVSDARKRSNSKHDKENWQYITFKARMGSKERIAEAADAMGTSVNGFIRDAISKAVMDAINKSLEPTPDEAAKAMWLRLLNDEADKLTPFELGSKSRKELVASYAIVIENNPSLYEETATVLSSDLPPKTKGKAIRDNENKVRKGMRFVLLDNLNELF